MSIVFVVMALSMFGIFTIELPSSIQTRLSNQSQKIKGGSFVMVFLLGAISALILGACVSPILISFLSVAIGTGDPALGGMTMFFLALGMGVPLIVAGLGAGHLLPRAGEWMNRIKYFFGVMLLAVAITVFNSLNLLPELLLWGVLFVVVGIYMGATLTLASDANGWRIFEKGLGTVLLIWGSLLLIGTAYNQEDIMHPLPKYNYSQNGSVEDSVMRFTTIKSMEQLEAKKQVAKETGKMVLIYFYTDWCSICKKLKSTTLVDPRVNKALSENYVALKVNMTDDDDKGSQEIKKKYQVYGPPVFVFYDKEGNKLDDETLYGYQDPKSFYDYLGLLAE
jgi:thiol:disulfide interchange protein DsbD